MRKLTAEESRISTGKAVRDIAVHYYAGLTKRSVKEVEGLFENVIHGEYNPLVTSALRLAEYELTHS
ncbi:hypothetical protein IX51_00955 [uncultured archaeon]|nr:hypothetical protein IX51_00955 [uncultured archaeon]